ncbi:hypothetical protein G5V59_21270 [Nocardioides sp. W3-2-3]|uniref:hypothetical protein n=1 Tax=Nocardioides convexus TaxID=2712224 RepID=UPI0024187936|nr:hypothetical protein [Nocardioides convexus]NHA01479.1 hypothetical protein [Nocardioides convexus]
MLPRFAIVARHRPVEIVGTPLVAERYDDPRAQQSSTAALPLLAPFAAVESVARGPRRRHHREPGRTGRLPGFSAVLDQGRVRITIRSGAAETVHRSRRHGRTRRSPGRLALALTGTHVSALTFEAGSWVLRARVDLAGGHVRSPEWLAGLTASWSSAEPGAVTAWRAGTFGQAGAARHQAGDGGRRLGVPHRGRVGAAVGDQRGTRVLRHGTHLVVDS